MILDWSGKEVQLVSNVRYTNVVTVKYVDGTQIDVPLLELKDTDGKQALVKAIRKIRVK